MIEIHPTARISPLADIEDSVRGTKIVIGAYSVIDSFCKIKPAGGSGDVIIGENVVVNSGCVIYSDNGVEIMSDAAIAANCVFAPVNHQYKNASMPIREQGFAPSKGGILIEQDVWIGAGCVFLDGAIVRRGCVIGAMSLVNKDTQSLGVYAGNPAIMTGLRE